MATPLKLEAWYGRQTPGSEVSWHGVCVSHPVPLSRDLLGVNEKGYIFRCPTTGLMFVAKVPEALEAVT